MLNVRIRALGALVMCMALCAFGAHAARADVLSPVVVVFPFQPNGSVPAQVGEQIASVLAQAIGNGGDVTVKPPPPTSTRETFRQDAQSLGASYYVSGYITPFGNGLSLIEYVASVRTGTIIYSATAEASSVGDVQTQAYTLKKALLELARRDSGLEVAAATPEPTATPDAAPTRAPQVAAAAAGRRWVVVNVAGSSSAEERAQAQQALVAALKAKGVDAVADADPAPQGPSLANVICSQAGGTQLVAAIVTNVGGARSSRRSIHASLLDCTSGASQRDVSGNGNGVDEAAQAAAAALLAPSERRHRR